MPVLPSHVVARFKVTASKAGSIADGSTVVYRGARDGKTGKIRGPAYFATVEAFAAGYGPTTAYRLNLKAPYLTDKSDWWRFANSSFISTSQVKEALREQSEKDGVRYDSVIADFGTIQAIFVLDAAKTAIPEPI